MINALTSVKNMLQRWISASVYDGVAGRKNALHLIQLRWIAVVGQIITIAVVNLVLHIPLPTAPLLGFVIFLVAFNLASALRWHESKQVARGELLFALLVDVFILTAQLHLSGGTQNPFAFSYLMQIVIGAVLLDTVSTWFLVLVASVCLFGLSRYAMPLQLPPELHAANLYTFGTVICFVMNAMLSTIFITRINQNLRERQAQVATMRERASEEDHIVRMGLLASGAAHELGTPLATMSVLLGDWQRLPAMRADAELTSDIHEMQTQLMRCKRIISGILSAAGEVRSESSVKVTALAFMDDLIQEWRSGHSAIQFEFDNGIDTDFELAFGTAIKQMLCNVLDNAAEVSPHWIKLSASRNDDELIFEVTDAGPGFAPVILEHVGKPYRSTKEGSGRGLGLFFVVNLARKLGGRVQVQNRVSPGALVVSGAQLRITLPMSAICLNFVQGGRSDD